MKLEDYLKLDAETYPEKVAVICKGETLTYSQLFSRVSRCASEWRSKGIGEGGIVPLESSRTIDYLVNYFAIHTLGAVAVPLEQGIPEEMFQQISERLSTCTIPADTADILFTTGTTGRSKGVMVSHKAIIADAENLIDAMSFTHENVFIINGPLNHAGCWSKVFPIIMLGGTLYLIKGMKNAEDLFTAMDYPSHKMAIFLVPASIRILLQFSSDRLAKYADKIDFIETGAAPMPHSDMLRLCEILPDSRLFDTYASTETGIITTYNYNDGRCIPGCLGKPMKHSKIMITDNGTLACQGDTLMTGYAGDEELTLSVLHDNTLFTTDLAQIDSEGMLHLLGRQDDVINVGGFKVAPSEVEEVAMALPEVKDCICISSPHPIMGNALKLLVVLNAGYDLDKKRIARYIHSKLETYKVPLAYQAVPSIHRTFNGKIDRKAYR
jgi:long-chain acyl-CoA synthetase